MLGRYFAGVRCCVPAIPPQHSLYTPDTLLLLLLKKLATLRRPIFVASALSSALLCTAILIAETTPNTYSMLFRDIGAVHSSPLALGLYSQLGLVLWSLAAGVLLLAVYRRRGGWGERRRYFWPD